MTDENVVVVGDLRGDNRDIAKLLVYGCGSGNVGARLELRRGRVVRDPGLLLLDGLLRRVCFDLAQMGWRRCKR